MVRPLMAWPEGTGSVAIGMFLLHFFSGISKAISILDVMSVFRCVTQEACGSSTSSDRNCRAQ